MSSESVQNVKEILYFESQRSLIMRPLLGKDSNRFQPVLNVTLGSRLCGMAQDWWPGSRGTRCGTGETMLTDVPIYVYTSKLY